MSGHNTSRRASFGRILHDLERLNEEQLTGLIDIARKVRLSRRMLRQVVQEAEQLLLAIPFDGRRKELPPLPAQAEKLAEEILSEKPPQSEV